MNLLMTFSMSLGGRVFITTISDGEVTGDLEVANWEDILENYKKTEEYNKV